MLNSAKYQKHSKAVTDNRAPAATKCEFRGVLAKDYGKRTFGLNENVLSASCIDLDALEVSRKGNNDRTIDLALGVASCNANRQTVSNHRLLLVELKMNLTGKSFNLGHTELLKKETHSRQSLLVGCKVEQYTYFLIPKEKMAQARSNKSRWQKETGGSAVRNWVFTYPAEFNNIVV